VIILEGPDGAGKSRLANQLSQDLGISIEPRVVSKKAEAMTDLRAWVEVDLATWPRAAIYDRHRLISEPIYGPLLRGRMEPGFDDRQWLTRMLEKMNNLDPTIIFCLPPYEIVKANVERDIDNQVVWEYITQVYWLYFMETCRHGSAFVWDYTAVDAVSFYEGMLARLKRSEHLSSTGGIC